MKHWLTGLPFRGALRVYENYALTGYEAVVLGATETAVRVASHNLFKGFVEELTWPKFLSKYVLALDATPAKQTDFLLHTLRTIATRGAPELIEMLKSHRATVRDDPPSLEELKMKKTANPPAAACVRLDYYKHSCIELSRTEKSVKYIPMTDGGLEVFERGIDAFEEEFLTVATDYPVEKAAAVYVRFAQHLGATKAALDALGRFIAISKKEYEMATAKPVTTTAAKPGVVKAGEKAKAAPKAPAAPKDKRVTVASRFQDLIMEGKLTDGEIFDVVQKEFKLDDSKKGYVSWYRNYLRKHGKNPPAPKGEPLKAPKKEPAEKKEAKPAAKKTAAAPTEKSDAKPAEKPATDAKPAAKVTKRPPPPAVKKATTKQAA